MISQIDIALDTMKVVEGDYLSIVPNYRSKIIGIFQKKENGVMYCLTYPNRELFIIRLGSIREIRKITKKEAFFSVIEDRKRNGSKNAS